MPTMPTVPIDWASVNWLYVAVLTVVVFFSTLIGTLLSFRRAFSGAVLSALLFAAAFVYLTYYPHGLPLPTMATAPAMPRTTAAPAPPVAPAAPSATVKPVAPDTAVSPPLSSPSGNSQ